MFRTLVISFLISMIPLIELRGAIPFGIGMMQFSDGNVPLSFLFSLYAVCLIGNMLPVPVIFFFARKVLEWGKDKKIIGKFFSFCLEKGHHGGEKLQQKAGRGVYLALFLFVGIPLPGTGAWTGTLAASLLDLDWKRTTLAVVSGVLLAGIIMLALSFGLASAAAM